MNRLISMAVNLVATFFIWVAVALVQVVADSSGLGTDTLMIIAVLTAFGLTVTLWLVWALTDYGEKAQPAREKNKRSTGHDTRLALLLELMDEDDREALKQQLMDEIGGDGEAISLADLLDTGEKRSGQRGSS
jgi:type VI protein secretion system component VasK